MGDKSKIEWVRGPDGTAGATWNPIRARNKATGGVGHFCVHVTEACRNCYAETMQKRFRNLIRYAAQDRGKVELFLDAKHLAKPLHWRKPRRVFLCSMTDLFLEDYPDAWIDQICAVAALCPQHIFFFLTKRGQRMQEYMTDPATPDRVDQAMDRIAPAHWCMRELEDCGLNGGWPLRNVWVGGSCHDQPSANEIIPQILATPAAVRFISAEPLLGPIDLRTIISPDGPLGRYVPFNCVAATNWVDGRPATRLDWAIVGGESGANARPMHPQWARALRDQCAAAGVAFFFKQWGVWHPFADVSLRHAGIATRMLEASSEHWDGCTWKVGKKAAGRLLDGVEHNGMPR